MVWRESTESRVRRTESTGGEGECCRPNKQTGVSPGPTARYSVLGMRDALLPRGHAKRRVVKIHPPRIRLDLRHSLAGPVDFDSHPAVARCAEGRQRFLTPRVGGCAHQIQQEMKRF